MPEPHPASIKSFASAKKLAEWLNAHHACEGELWIKMFEVKSGKPSVTWAEIVVAATGLGRVRAARMSSTKVACNRVAFASRFI